MEIQLSFWDALMDLLLIEPILWLGIVFIAILLFAIFKRDSSIPKVKTSILSVLLYGYLCIVLTHIVGIPTLHEFMRLSQLGESFFNPYLNLIPFVDGVSQSFILNIFLFVPIGFLCPLISKTFARAKYTFFMGFGLSLLIEVVQLFTLYRITDINDLFANVIGMMLGYFCFRLLTKLRKRKHPADSKSTKPDSTVSIPLLLILLAFVFCALGT